MTLDELRARLTVLDRELVERMAERERLSREVAAVKRATGYPTRDFQRERDVLLRARAQATELGASPDLAEQIMSLLITDSLATQEKALVSARAAGSGKRALVIGGRGKMGGWFAEFLASLGPAHRGVKRRARRSSSDVISTLLAGPRRPSFA